MIGTDTHVMGDLLLLPKIFCCLSQVLMGNSELSSAAEKSQVKHMEETDISGPTIISAESPSHGRFYMYITSLLISSHSSVLQARRRMVVGLMTAQRVS
ncbi:hypothetical protein GDO81_023002 [Engystomops pustulosus]|uniref:Uncharacterized protein n=1 Tax=Engystomops pustulosus TaxID=76066 RepID=A0AAV6ZA86_ENGPU|nr:hypothetical protein GDO81_023002 [Engystomops pustulosus]